MSEEKCARCGEVGEDRRTLWMACFYAMQELGIKFEERVAGDLTFFTLRVCKDCRGDWLGAIKEWFNEKPEREGTGTGVWIRDNGTNREATPEEVEQMIREREARKTQN